jgi:hypothetical protein
VSCVALFDLCTSILTKESGKQNIQKNKIKINKQKQMQQQLRTKTQMKQKKEEKARNEQAYFNVALNAIHCSTPKLHRFLILLLLFTQVGASE